MFRMRPPSGPSGPGRCPGAGPGDLAFGGALGCLPLGFMLPAGYLTGLEEGRYSAPYRGRLAAGLLAFRHWLRQHGPVDVQLTRSHRRGLDAALAVFVNFCFKSGAGYDLAKLPVFW